MLMHNRSLALISLIIMLLTITAWVLYSLYGHRLIEAAYRDESFGFLNSVITDRGGTPLGFYLGYADQSFHNLAILTLIGFGMSLLYSFFNRFWFFLLMILLFSMIIYYPSFRFGYFQDALDNLYSAARVSGFTQFKDWLFEFHNEHFVPIIKGIYYACYKLFWLDPAPFHILVKLTFLACIVLCYKLLYQLTGSKGAALFGCGFFGFSAVYKGPVMFVAASPVLFCLFFTLGLLYSTYLYAKTEKGKWMFFAFLCGLAGPATFALGALNGIWLILFFLFCIPEEHKRGLKKKLKIIFLPIAGWSITASVYVISLREILHSSHYLDYGQSSGISAFNPFDGIYLSLKTIFLSLIPKIFMLPELSLLFFLAFALCMVIMYKHVPWATLIFFSIWTVGNYAGIYVFRAGFGEKILHATRYNLFPALGLSSIYAVTFHAAFRTWGPRLNLKGSQFVIPAAMIFLIISTWVNSMEVWNLTRGPDTWFAFSRQFREAMVEYRKLCPSGEIRLEDKILKLPVYPHPRPVRYFATFILPRDIRTDIVWGEETDVEFSGFLCNNISRYSIFAATTNYHVKKIEEKTK